MSGDGAPALRIRAFTPSFTCAHSHTCRHTHSGPATLDIIPSKFINRILFIYTIKLMLINTEFINLY